MTSANARANQRQRLAARSLPGDLIKRVYHFSSTLALPWIVESGELRPSTPDEPINNYLWATTQEDIGPSSWGSRNLLDWWETGQAQMIRFTCSAADFIPWAKIIMKPPWTPERAKHWETSHWEHFGERVSNWHVRRDPLPLASVLRVDVLVYGDRWRRIKTTRKQCTDLSYDPPTKAINIDGFEYYSTRMQSYDGYFDYVVPDREELAEMWDELNDEDETY